MAGTRGDLFLGPLLSQHRRVNWVSLVEDGSNSLVRAPMMKVEAERVGLVEFVYGVQVGGSGST